MSNQKVLFKTNYRQKECEHTRENENDSNNNMDSDDREKKVTDVIDFPNNIFVLSQKIFVIAN